MFEWVIRKEIDGSVGHGGFAEDTYAKAGGFSGYWQVWEVDIVVGFQGRAKLNAPVDSVNVLQYVVWVGRVEL